MRSEERQRHDEHPRGVGRVGGDREHHQRARRDPAQRGGDQPGALADQTSADEEQGDGGADPRQRAEQLERDDVGAVEQVGERRVEVGLDRERVDGAAEHDRELAAQDLERLDARVGLVGVDHRRRRVEQQPPDHDPGEEHERADDQRGRGDPPGGRGRFVVADADDVVGERDPVGFDSGTVGLGFVDHDDLQSVPSRPLVVRRRWWHIGQQGHAIPWATPRRAGAPARTRPSTRSSVVRSDQATTSVAVPHSRSRAAMASTVVVGRAGRSARWAAQCRLNRA